MTKQQEAKSIIIASFMLYLIDSVLDPKDKTNATTIRLKQLLRTKTSIAQNKAYVEMSNQAWADTIEDLKDGNYRIAIFDAIEYLAFDNEEILTKMFGPNIITYASAFALKQTKGGIDKEILEESRIVTQRLKKNTERILYLNRDKL
jgi:hypothetical protein